MTIYKCDCSFDGFKDDYSQLCQNCALKPLIDEGINNQIIYEAKIQKDILNEIQFEKYISDEVQNASNAIQATLLSQRNQKNIDYKNTYLGNRIMNVIWNKERIKVLNKMLSELHPKSQNLHPDIFVDDNSFLIFKRFQTSIDEKKELANYSFIYRRMSKEFRIKATIRQTDFIKFIDEHYKVVLTKLKVENLCSPSSRVSLYNEICREIVENSLK